MKTTGPTEELPVVVHGNENSDEDPEEDPDEGPEEDPGEDSQEPEEDSGEECEEYIEEVSEEELESDSIEDLEEEESNAEPNKETGFADKVSKDKKTTISKTTNEVAVSEALDVESAPKERRGKTRWDSQPEQDGKTGEGGNGIKLRKTRWGGDVSQSKTVAPFQLPESLSDFVDSESDSRLRWLKQKLVALGEEMLKLEACESDPEKEKARRMHIKFLVEKKQKLLAELFLKDSKLRDPEDRGRRAGRIFKKVYIPVKEYPSYNFIGLILGPRGSTLKKMEVESGASIKLRGKGSSLGKEAKPEDDDEDLHVYIEAYTEKSIETAVAMVKKFLVPLDDKDNKIKLAQLEELANIKGTNFRACQLCNDPSHKTYACPNRKSTFEKVASCTKCGSLSHFISQCPLNMKPNPIKVINEANIYVGYLPQTADKDWLKERFCPFGKITSVKVITDQTTGLSKGYGFVNFESPIDAAVAANHMNGHQVEGKTLAVRVAGLPPRPKVPVLHPFPPSYPRPVAISPNIPGFTGPWISAPGFNLSPELHLEPGLPTLYPILPYPRPAAISANSLSQMDPWSGQPGPSQNTKDPLGQYYTPALSKATDMPSQIYPNSVYAKQAPGSSSGSSQFPGDRNYRSSSSLFPGDPDYRSSSSLFPGDPDYRGSSSFYSGDLDS